MIDAEPTQAELEANAGQRNLRHVHFFLNPKGGVGKSFAARIMTEYTGGVAYDADENNKTMSIYRNAFDVYSVNLMQIDHAGIAHGAVGAVNTHSMDQFIEHLVAQKAVKHMIVDFGSHQFAPMFEYIVESDFVSVMNDNDIDTWIHVLVCGGTSQPETVQAMERMAKGFMGMRPRPKMIFWQNEYFGEIDTGAPPDASAHDHIHDVENIAPGGFAGDVENLPCWSDVRRMFKGGVVLRRRSGIFENDLQQIQLLGLSFNGALDGADTPLMAKSRIKRIWTELESQLDKIFTSQASARAQASDEAMRQLGEAQQRRADALQAEADADPTTQSDEDDTMPADEHQTIQETPTEPNLLDSLTDDETVYDGDADDEEEQYVYAEDPGDDDDDEPVTEADEGEFEDDQWNDDGDDDDAPDGTPRP